MLGHIALAIFPGIQGVTLDLSCVALGSGDGKMGALYTQKTEVGYFIAMVTIGWVAALLLAICLPWIRRAMTGAD
ncbi:hypothetical protein SAMN02745148_01038 [Modicisalibacter ilicicola DSM 19980]|uniref:Uncharacterized protein n=1 Tax=Modicisalibacter ilicicola DSM 19980 TaxID=1121942 RepID=A0A1M4W199_9GAMM|nr:hypothetical protein [Halomonas ilicicola]SHE74987.1 hypothetical protein SAMN02745148_01038 [Halomonas ilicicola DSM 19980]